MTEVVSDPYTFNFEPEIEEVLGGLWAGTQGKRAIPQTVLGGMTISAGLTVVTGGARVNAGGVTIDAGGLLVTAGGATITAGGLLVSAGGATVTGNSSITGTLLVTGLLTASTGISVTASGITIVAGGLTVTAGGATITAGGLTVSAGTTALQATNITGNATIVGGTLTLDNNQRIQFKDTAGTVRNGLLRLVTSDILVMGTNTAAMPSSVHGSEVTVVTGDATPAINLTLGGNTAALTVGFLGATAQTKQTSGENLTNNVSSGGTDGTIANFTDLAVYANDALTIRRDIYQLARKLKQVNDALRLYGLLS